MEISIKLQNIYLIHKDKIEEILENSINDWPTEINSYEAYYNTLVNFIGENITKRTVLNKLKTISVLKYPWESESLYQLCYIFDFFDEDIDLYQILIIAKRHNSLPKYNEEGNDSNILN